jgi:phosphoglycerol transferase MdoB-like AlkP superfamily enzyme
MGRRFIEPEFFLADQVPLLIRVPGAADLAGERRVVAGHADIAPTLLALLGIDPAPLPMMGRNLLGEPGTGPVVCRYGTWVDETHLYVNTGLELGDGRCYPLDTLEQVDPAACAAGLEIARRQLEVASRVLSYDLQQRLRASLEAAADTDGAGR